MDAELFHFVNTSMSNPVFDAFFPWFTNVHHTLVFKLLLVPALLVCVFWFYRWRGVALAALGAGLTWAADQANALLLKPLSLRARPYEAGLEVVLRIGRPSGTSFPSSHTLDTFFLAAFFSVFFPRARTGLWMVAGLMGFSRVYNGVHYPGDVLGGAVIGCSVGFACALILSRVSLFREGFR